MTPLQTRARARSRPDRRELIAILAWSLNDLLPAPRSAAPKGVQRGPSPEVWELCQACDGERLVNGLTCVSCAGEGRYRVDDHLDLDRRVQSADSAAPARTMRVRCGRCGGDGMWRHRRCEVCSGDGTLEVPVTRAPAAQTEPPEYVDAVAEAIARRDQAGDWHLVDRALTRLRLQDRHAFRVFASVHLSGDLAVAGLDPLGREALERAFVFVGDLLPGKIRVHPDIVEAYRQRPSRPRSKHQLHREIRRLANQGLSPQSVSEQLGVSERTVQRVVYARRAA